MDLKEIEKKKEEITWLICDVERLNKILKIGNSNKTGEDFTAPLAPLASLVSL